MRAPRPATASRAAWQELEAKKPAGDVLLVSKRAGEAVDYLTGVLGDVSDSEAQFDWDGEMVRIKRAKIVALGYYHDNAATLADPVCKLTLSDGSRVPARDVALVEDKLRVTTPAGSSRCA